MKKTIAAVFLAFLFAMGLGLAFLPKTAFSAQEKRYLAEFPKPGWQTVTSGQWGEELETWLADHLPGRTFFVGLNAYQDLLLGQQDTKDIRKVGNRLVEAPKTADPAVLEKNRKALTAFAEKIGQPITAVLIPSAGWAMGLDGYTDDAIIRQALDGASVQTLDLLPVFQNRPELFYRTDHHWNSAGAYAGYAAILEGLGKQAVPASAFAVETLPDCFRGSTYSRSALWLTPAEPLELWQGSAVSVENETGTVHDGVFYRERLEEADKYTVFLDGNHSLVRLTNPRGQGKLLVIRDSYSNCLGCFLAENYGEVVLVDLRYYKQPVSALAAQEGFDDILFCYSLSNYLTDTNIVWLR